MMFDTKVIFFISVVEEGSFSAAAKKHYISQSAISQSITKLEDELGYKLFDRSKYRPVLTISGKYYYDGIRRLMNDYDKITKNALNMASKPNKITIGVTNNFERKHILRIIKEIKQDINIKIDIKYIEVTECLNQLKNKKLDLCFGTNFDFDQVSYLNSIPVYDGHVCIVCSQNHPLSKYHEVTIDMFKDEPMILLVNTINPDTQTKFLDTFELDGYIPNIAKECDNLQDYFMSIQLDEGIGFTLLELVDGETDLCTIPVKNTHHHSTFSISYRKDNSKSQLQDLIQYISDYFKRL